MATWLHDLDTLDALTRHPEALVRRWAVPRRLARPPAPDPIAVGRRLLDDDDEVLAHAARHLAADPDRADDPAWQRVLRRALELAETPDRKATLLDALAHTADAEVGRSARELLARPRSGRLLAVAVGALARHPTEGAAEALLPLLERLEADEAFAGLVSTALLAQDRRAAAHEVVSAWRRWPVAQPSFVLGAVVDHLAPPGDLPRLVPHLADEGPRGVLARARAHLGVDLLSDDAVDALHDAWVDDRLARGAVRVLHEVLGAREAPIHRWIAAEDLGPARSDPRRVALLADDLLGALARSGRPDPARRREDALAMLALLTVAGRPHDARPSVLGPWRHVAPDAAEGLDDAALLDALARHPVAHVRRRVLDVLAARQVSANTLVEALEDPVLAVAAQDHLTRRGPEAVDALLDRLTRPSPPAAALALLGALPTREGLDHLVALATRAEAPSGPVARALADHGHPDAVDALRRWWQPGMPHLAILVDRCAAVAGVADAERAPWKQDVLTGLRAPPGEA